MMIVRNTEEELGITKNPGQMAPIALAFIGDSVFDLFLRTKIVIGTDVSPKKMHLQASRFARAEAQAQMAEGIWNMLTEREQEIIRRGRNAKVHTIPKHAEVMQYKIATGFEALLGVLYLEQQDERLWEVMEAGYRFIAEKEEEHGDRG
ncbi:MAG: Mini-ribonuclease 3 [Firmicutes bacterium]|nr:Mini-ribonuclease 3 [Bacillota bacterium]